MSDGATKSCPFCGEQILAVAIKCKHCQSALDAPKPAHASGGDALGVILMLVPWIGVALLWFWVGETPLINAANNLSMVIGATIVATAIVAALDASAIGFGVKGTPAERASGPGATFAYVLLLWIVMYPVHVHERAKYGGRRKQTLAAIFGAAAFAGSAGYLGYLINDKFSTLENALNGPSDTNAPREYGALPPVGSIEVRHPPNLTSRAAKDWDSVVQKVYEHDFGKALHELDAFEKMHGICDESANLRAQLKRLPAEMYQ